MTDGQSTKKEYALGYGDATVAWMASRHVGYQGAFLAKHLASGMSLLDCGCGPGTLTCGLAEIVAPGRVNAVDVELTQIEKARALAAEKGLQNIEFQQASILELPFDDNSFDAVFVSAVMGNIDRPYDAVKEVFRVLKPGGIAGLREFDHGGNMAFPQSPMFARSVNLYIAMRKRNGHAEDFGRELKGAMHEAGFADIEARGVYETYSSPEEIEAYAKGIVGIFEEMFGDKAIKLGLIDQASYQEMIQAWQDWAEDPAAFFATGWVEAIGRKTGP